MLLSGCSGLKDAFSAHTDRVATAADAELTVPRLGQLLGKSRAPIRKDIAKSIASVWVANEADVLCHQEVSHVLFAVVSTQYS